MNRTLSLLLTIFHFIVARRRWHALYGVRLRRYQERRARRIVDYANNHSLFYRLHWAGHNLRDWRTLPTVDKKSMMDNFDGFNTVGLHKEDAMEVALHAERSRDFSPTLQGYTVGLSSGTSGHRGIFLASAYEQAAWAGCILARTLHDLRPRRLRVAFFLRSNSNLYEKIGGIFIQFRFFDLMLPLDQAISSLNNFKPHIVVAPPSLLGFLADAREKKRLHITPERLISVAEVLEPQDEERLRTVFKAPVHQIYQCTEGLLAISCTHGSLHIQEDLVAMQFENIDAPADNMPSSTDRVSPIVTDLWRTTQPIIRYRLNDVLRISPRRCTCGSTFRVIEAVEGRCDDLLIFHTQDGSERPFFPDTIRRMILLASPQIEDYYATQSYPDHLHIHLSIAPSASFQQIAQEVTKSVQQTLAQYNCPPAEVEITQGLPLVPQGTKRRRVVRDA